MPGMQGTTGLRRTGGKVAPPAFVLSNMLNFLGAFACGQIRQSRDLTLNHSLVPRGSFTKYRHAPTGTFYRPLLKSPNLAMGKLLGSRRGSHLTVGLEKTTSSATAKRFS
jgi:hypothetical protein